jgi:hypothetical protein
MTLRPALLALPLIVFALINSALAETAAFDLSGPRVEVTVTRAGKTLPISAVPNLAAGDRIWLHPDLPEGQSVHYLMIVAFLRGSTNPPPDSWFIKAETWTKQVRNEGIVVTVPKDAQQALLFLAPETGGDFSSLRSAVQGKPGAFVRASQDLNLASLDRSRSQQYLDAVKLTSNADPNALHQRSILLARSLGIKLDQTCFAKPPEQQLSCLVQNTDQMVLDDEHSQSTVAMLTTGPASDLIGQVSSTPMARGGYYSPYVGAVVDVARLMSTFRTPEYQYIPSLALLKADELNLKLNNPPSFRKPKSVLVVGLPPVEAEQFPPLRSLDPTLVSCLQKPSLVLPADEAPLVFSTAFAHDLVLHIESKTGAIDLPATADAAQGGFSIDTRTLPAAQVDPALSGTIRGYWGFQAFSGPGFLLRSAHPAKWTLAPTDGSALIVGREDTIHLTSDAAACVEIITFKDAPGKILTSKWNTARPDELEIQIPLEGATPGAFSLLVKQTGIAEPDEVPLHSYSEAAHLEHFMLNTGDRAGVLEGNRLDEVEGLELKDVRFKPDGLLRAQQRDELRLDAGDTQPIAALHTNDQLVAHVLLKDGRVLELQTTVEPPRPKATLISKAVQLARDSPLSAVRLANLDDLPQGGRLSFFLKTEIPASFPREETIEVAAADESFHILLSLADGTLTRQDSQTVLAVLDPAKAFGPSAFGALRYRAIDADGAKGDWQPLANLVRVPALKEIRCSDDPEKLCTLIGADLFLIDSVSATSSFAHFVAVPLGFGDSALKVPRPNGTLLYIKLRDDPASINGVALPVQPE